MSDLNIFATVGLNKETALRAITYFGIGSIVGLIFWVGTKIFDLGRIMQRLATVEADIKEVKKEVRKGNKDLAKRIDDLMLAFAQSSVTEAHSPRQLTNEGKRILKDSGINTIVDDKFDYIVREVAKRKPENAYQAERSIIDVVISLAADPAIKDAVEEGAFNSGSSAPIVLVVGATYIRDRVLKELGLKPEEIDEHAPKPKNK